MLEDAIDEFLIDCKVRNLSDRTISTYENNLRKLLLLLKNVDVISVKQIKRPIMQAIILEMRTEGLKTAYINTILKAWKVLYKYLYESGYIKENVMEQVKLLKESKTVLQTFNDEELSMMLKYWNKKGFLNQRNKLIIEMMADTGIRVSELRSIQNNQIKDGFMIVRGKGNKERIVPLSPFLQKSIIKYNRTKYDYFRNLRVQREIDDFLFVTKSGAEMKSNVMIELIVKEAAVSAKVRDEVTRQSCHSLRHYFAQKLLRNGTNVYTISRLLGHSSLKTTQIYLQSLSDYEIAEDVITSTPLMQLIREGKM